MAYNKMNKTCPCAGRLRASIPLKCKNKFTIKKFYFQPIMNFPPKVFGSRFDPNMAIKRSTKVHKSTWDYILRPVVARWGGSGQVRYTRPDPHLRQQLLSWGCLTWMPGKSSIHVTWPTLTYSSSYKRLSPMLKASSVGLGLLPGAPSWGNALCYTHGYVERTTNTVGTGDCDQREPSRVISDKIKNCWCSIKSHHNQYTTQVPEIFTTRPRSFIADQPTSHFRDLLTHFLGSVGFQL